jgi:hypothetical protein
MEPKNADLIYCIDKRGEEPKYVIFNMMLDQVYSLKEENFFTEEEPMPEDMKAKEFEIEKLKLYLDDEKPEDEVKTFAHLEEENPEGAKLWLEYRKIKMKQLKKRCQYILKYFPKKIPFVPAPTETDKQ